MQKRLKARPDGRGPFPKEEIPKPNVLKDVPRKYSRYGIPLSIFRHELDQVPLPNLVLITCTMTYWYPGVQIVIELIREKFGQVPVILGGIYASLMPEHARNTSGADIVFQGPAEKGILSLIRDVLGDNSCPANQFETIDEIPWPDFSFLRDKDTLPLLTSRGCPFKCSFCAAPLLFQNFEQRSPSSVVAEIEHHYRQQKVRNIAFYDDALLLNKDRHISYILKEIIKKELPLSFHTPNGLHVREIDYELASLFKQANFQSLFLSQESFDEKMLEDSCSKVSSDDLENALVNLEKAGYRREETSVYLMVGLLEQEVSGIKESIFQVQRLGAVPRLAYFSPVPGTKEWRNLVEKGCLDQNADPLLHNKLVFPYYWGNISPQEFESLKDLINAGA